ncbi:MAG: prenyltransferase/squalene oxidase repeat-containing protein [Planctomycetota bacterium]
MSRSNESKPFPTPPTGEAASDRLPVRAPTLRPTTKLPTPVPQTKPKRRRKQNGDEEADEITSDSSRRPRLTREKFDALRLLAREVDEYSLGDLRELPDSLDPEATITIVETVGRHRKPLSSFLISTTFHLLLFLGLTWLMIPQTQSDSVISISAKVEKADPLDKQPVDLNVDQTTDIDLPDEQQSPVESTLDATALDSEIAMTDVKSPVPSPTQSEPQPIPDLVQVEPVGELSARPTGGGLEGRNQQARAKRAGEMGGSAASEAAVEKGLAWIIEHQQKDGSWRLRHDQGACRGQCPDEGLMESSTAATGMALMSLLGAGYTHKSGPYQTEVEAGLKFLLKSMRRTKRGASLCRGEQAMYSHGIATIAIAEAFVMTKDSWLAEPAEAARFYIENAQNRKGGWRYNPGNVGDMTVTGWQLMALKSCQLGGADSPKEVWTKAESFIDSLRTSSGYYGYQKPEERLTTTAVAALMKMYLGAGKENADVQTAAEYVAGEGPSETDMYFNYYGTQVLFHRGGKDWKRWNEKLRDYLILTQDQSGTHRTGSWHFQDRHGNVGGRLYTTAMAIMTLEVYYRYMPLYGQDVDAHFELDE